MDKMYFLNAEMPPPLHFESSTVPNWQSTSDCCLHFTHLVSPFSPMLSSTTVAPSNTGDNFTIGELLGKHGNVSTSGGVLPQHHQLLVAPTNHIGGGYRNTNTSCYTTPLNSPPKQHLTIMGHTSLPLNPVLPTVSAGQGFMEQPPKLACIANPSISGRSGHFGSNNTPFMVMGGAKSPRVVLSGPPLKAAALQLGGEETKNSVQAHKEIRSKGQSLVSEQNPSREAELRTPSDSNSRKRKAVSRGKSKEIAIATKGREAEEHSKSKRTKHSGTTNNEEEANRKTSSSAGDGCRRRSKTSPKAPEPPKDYIHVRARRGQATDSHSLAERARREKISERMKLLQGLVPGCSKITGKTVMLDEIINYVRALQNQVEFLSMKIASADLSHESNMDSLLQNVMIHQNGSFLNPTYPLDTLMSPSGGCQRPQQIPQVHNEIPKGVALNQCSVDPFDTSLCQNTAMRLASVDECGQVFSQFPTSCENDLQTIVQMGFRQNMKNSQGVTGSSNQSSNMKIEVWSPFINP